MKWFLKDNVIYYIQNNQTIYPRAIDIFASEDFNLDISLSTFMSLNFDIVFDYADSKVILSVNVKKGKLIYKLLFNDGLFLDYIIIDKVCYYLDPTINVLNEIVKGRNINDFSFLDFLVICKFLNKDSINYIDNVSSKIDEIKKGECSINDPNFNGKLFPYQENGVKWLSYMVDGNCGCILADSMGLGKTLQVILTLGHLKNSVNGSHSLIIAPLSILENWKREIQKFYPSLKCHINYGADNLTYYKELLDYDVIITSYNSVQTNFSVYEMIMWDLIILDEAQNIKNPSAKRTQTIKQIPKKMGIAVSGTPFENHVTDVWSIVDFVLPNYLGTLKEFNNTYTDDVFSAKDLEYLITPIMIRRRVEDVADDLPERIDIPEPILMTYDEAKLYDDSLKTVAELNQLKIDIIQKLRLFCTHPIVHNQSLSNSDPYTLSHKYQRCCDIVEEVVQCNEKAIIFTSFNKMSEIMVTDLNKRFNVPTFYINGSIEGLHRQEIIDDFSKIDGAAVLIANPKAAGAGLNITAANHVIHYNLEWNPAIEDQASARAYRRGQNKTVFIHRLFYTNTIEEIINEKIENKRILSNTAIVGNDGSISTEDIKRILSMTPMEGGFKNEI